MDFSKRQIIGISLILLVMFSFAFLDIGLYSSNENSDSSISASSAGDDGYRPDYNDIILYVHQEDSFDERVEKELITALETKGLSVTLTDEIKDDYSLPFAFVNIIDRKMLYTPVYSKSDIDVLIGFSSAGKSEYLDVVGSGELKTVVFRTDATNPYQLLVQGNIGLYDETKGLFTYRSYQNHIAQEVAESAADALDSQIRKGQ
ncbi:hypothetical protein V7O66_04660 [Methanolobus sp. ZRKC3]|uniref:hypothetical protein n=1 Tax=Methanolobus sp. ZRKC3 TaxID=3125786 RepID=UPI00325078AA